MIPEHIAGSMKLPLVAAPMFLISDPQLVLSCCTNGIIGSFPALNQRTTDGYEEWLLEIKSKLDAYNESTATQPAPYAVNLIVHHSNPRLMADLKITVKHQVPIVITSLGAVSDVVDAVHSYGGLVWHDVTNRRHAEKAIEAGVDGLICVSAGAGGHAGMLNPMPFLAEIRSMFDGTILLAGCISTGRDVIAALTMGADLAYMGTRFINTEESRAPEEYKQSIMESSVSDIIYTAAVSGVPASFLRSSLESAGITKDRWHEKKKIDFGKELDAAEAEAKAWKTIWSAGQGVTAIKDVVPLSTLLETIKEEMKQTLEEQQELFANYPF